MSGRDDYYDRQTVTIQCEVEIAWKRGSKASKNDAMRRATDLYLNAMGASEHGCYSAQLLRAKRIANDPQSASRGRRNAGGA